MLLKRIIPCLDVRDGRVVKGVGFEGLRDVGDPAELAARYDADGADEIVVLDVAATVDGRDTMIETIRRVREAVSVPVVAGGGVRSVEDAGRLLASGADKVSVNSAAVRRPDLVREISGRFGRQCVVVAIDAMNRGFEDWEVMVDGGGTPTGIDAVEWSARVVGLGAGEILLTSRDRDGTGIGYDLAMVGRVADSVGVPVIASGGARTAADLESAFEAGATGALLAGVLHDRITSLRELRLEMAAIGRELRPC